MAVDDEQFIANLSRVFAQQVEGCTALLSADRLSGGASQETYCVRIRHRAGERSFALRRAAGKAPHSQAGLGIGLANEAELIQIASAVGVPTPAVLYVLNPTDGLGEGFIMSWLEGETLGTRIVRDPALAPARTQLPRQCGEILAQIHAIDIEAHGLQQILASVSTAAYVQDMWRRYRDLNVPAPMIDYTARWLLSNLPASDRRTLVHNDFRNGNIMVDENGIVGVLDWEIAYLGDPMRDLGWLTTKSWRFGRHDLPVGGFGEYAELLAAYELASGYPVDRDALRFWEIFGSFWWAIACLTMADQARHGCDPSVERLAIGRRSSESQIDCVNYLLPADPNAHRLCAHTPETLPSSVELLSAARGLLHDELMPQSSGRLKFLARVAANSVEIVEREIAMGPAARDAEYRSLSALFDDTDSLQSLRWRLVNEIRDGRIGLDNRAVQTHLRATVTHQIMIDQPNYPGVVKSN